MNLLELNPTNGVVTFNASAIAEPIMQGVLSGILVGVVILIVFVGCTLLGRYLRALTFLVKLRRWL